LHKTADMATLVVEMSQPEYSFPLKPRTQSHSRKYTVDLGTGPQVGAGGGSSVGGALLTAQPGSRRGRHSHKRSGAISHDFGTDGGGVLNLSSPSPTFSTKSAFGSEHRSPYGTSPALTFTSSNSSLPHQSAVSLAISDGSCDTPAEPAAKQVSFADEQQTRTQAVQTQQEPVRVRSEAMSDGPRATSGDRRRRHKKVKSWAGGFLRLHLHRKTVAATSSSERPGLPDSPVVTAMVDDFRSSSYIPAQASVMCDEDVASPVIDLDAALGPFKTPTMLRASQTASELFSFSFSHRRTESAPEYVLSRGGVKRKMGPVVEEEDETDAGAVEFRGRDPVTGSTGNPTPSVAQTMPRQRSGRLARPSLTSVNETAAAAAGPLSSRTDTPSMACALGEPGPEVVRYSVDGPPSSIISGSASTTTVAKPSSRLMASRVLRLFRPRPKQT
jgi:hypothetical protein